MHSCNVFSIRRLVDSGEVIPVVVANWASVVMFFDSKGIPTLGAIQSSNKTAT